MGALAHLGAMPARSRASAAWPAAEGGREPKRSLANARVLLIALVGCAIVSLITLRSSSGGTPVEHTHGAAESRQQAGELRLLQSSSIADSAAAITSTRHRKLEHGTTWEESQAVLAAGADAGAAESIAASLAALDSEDNGDAAGAEEQGLNDLALENFADEMDARQPPQRPAQEAATQDGSQRGSQGEAEPTAVSGTAEEQAGADSEDHQAAQQLQAVRQAVQAQLAEQGEGSVVASAEEGEEGAQQFVELPLGDPEDDDDEEEQEEMNGVAAQQQGSDVQQPEGGAGMAARVGSGGGSQLPDEGDLASTAQQETVASVAEVQQQAAVVASSAASIGSEASSEPADPAAAQPQQQEVQPAQQQPEAQLAQPQAQQQPGAQTVSVVEVQPAALPQVSGLAAQEQAAEQLVSQVQGEPLVQAAAAAAEQMAAAAEQAVVAAAAVAEQAAVAAAVAAEQVQQAQPGLQAQQGSEQPQQSWGEQPDQAQAQQAQQVQQQLQQALQHQEVQLPGEQAVSTVAAAASTVAAAVAASRDEEEELEAPVGGAQGDQPRRRKSAYHRAVQRCDSLECLRQAALGAERYEGQYRVPHFLAIGWQHAATDWLLDQLASHPGVQCPGEREPEFFTDDCQHDLAGCTPLQQRDYIQETLRIDRLLRNNLRRAVGEGSPQYADDGPRIAAGLQEVFPWVKLVASMREPISRAIAMLADKTDAESAECVTTRDVYSCLLRDLPGLNYTTPFSAWLDAYPAQQIMLIQYENLTHPDHTKDTLQSVHTFLELDASAIAADPSAFSSPAKLPGQELAGWPMKRQEYEKLVQLVKPDVERLAAMIADHGLGDSKRWMANWEKAWQASLNSCNLEDDCLVQLS